MKSFMEMSGLNKLIKKEAGNKVEIEDIQSFEDLEEIYDEFGGGQWEEESHINTIEEDQAPEYLKGKKKLKVGRENDESVRDVRETGNPDAIRQFDNDDFMMSVDEEENDAWENKTHGEDDIENIASNDDDYAQFDNISLNDMVGHKLSGPREVISKKQLPLVVEHFKRMKDAKEYSVLIENQEKFMNLHPKRGTRPLSAEEISKEIADFHDKRAKSARMSKAEYYFAKQCEAFVWAMEKIKDNKIVKPIVYKPLENAENAGRDLTDQEIASLCEEYDTLKDTDPKDFAIMELELRGAKKVESGAWQKAEFVWETEEYQGKIRWTYEDEATKTKYVTNQDPTKIAELGQPADFFFTERQAFTSGKGKLVFIDLMLPYIPSKKQNQSQKKVYA